MKPSLTIISFSLILCLFNACSRNMNSDEVKIIFLHHSTGGVIWTGEAPSLKKSDLPRHFAEYNKQNKTNYQITQTEFPKASPYGWNNYPFDYYNIWVKNGGSQPYMEEPTLELLTEQYDVIIFKHCFPVSNILPDSISQNIDSDIKTIANYKLQYEALKNKLHQFPDNKFVLWTGAAQVESAISDDEAKRAKEFFSWVINEWDLPGDNIFIWDFYTLETDGGLYLRDEYAESPTDAHPNSSFAKKAVNLLFYRIIDIIANDGNTTTITGEKM